MAIRENRFIDFNSALGRELFTFFNVGPDSRGIYNLGSLPRSAYLNKKSKYLPFGNPPDTIVKDAVSGDVYSKYTKLSPDMIKQINYGRDFKAYDDALTAIRGVAARTNFVYIEPANWFRLPDFWGYDHAQPDWFSFSTQVSSLGIGSSTPVNQENLTEIFTFGKLSGLSASTVNFGFLMWNAQFSETQPQVYFYSCTNAGNPEQKLDVLLQGGPNRLQIAANTSNGLGQGTWRMYPVITTANFTKDSFTYIRDTTANGKWYPFPYANTHILNVVGSGQGDDNVIGNISVSLDFCDIRLVDPNSLTHTLHTLSVMFSNEGSATYTVNYDWSIRGATNQINKPSNTTGKIQISAGRTSTVELYSTKNEDEAYRFAVGELPVQMNFAYWIDKDNGNTDEDMIVIDLESK